MVEVTLLKSGDKGSLPESHSIHLTDEEFERLLRLLEYSWTHKEIFFKLLPLGNKLRTK